LQGRKIKPSRHRGGEREEIEGGEDEARGRDKATGIDRRWRRYKGRRGYIEKRDTERRGKEREKEAEIREETER
jgi:hypothetical protein